MMDYSLKFEFCFTLFSANKPIRYIISVALPRIRKVKPAIINAAESENLPEYHPKNGPIIANRMRIMKLRTERTVALTSDAVSLFM